jgi:hypothetical protein
MKGRNAKHRKWHASVRINSEQYNVIKGYFLDVCAHRSVEQIRKELQMMPFEPYAPVRRQMLNILRAMNRRRRSTSRNSTLKTASVIGSERA